jgi:hypothetical protein
MFNEELNAVKKELTQKSQPQSPIHPKYSGQGLWARQLKRRTYSVLKRCFYHIIRGNLLRD